MDKMENVVRNFKRGIITLDEAETCVIKIYAQCMGMAIENSKTWLSQEDYNNHTEYLLESLTSSLREIKEYAICELPKDIRGEVITVDTIIGHLEGKEQKEIIACLESDAKNNKYIKENEHLSAMDIDVIHDSTIEEFLGHNNDNFEKYVKENFGIECTAIPFN